MARISKIDTNGSKSLLAEGELGLDNYVAGGDTGRVYVGDGTSNISLALSGDFGDGTYTPSLTNTTNVASSSVNGDVLYLKVGDVVQVSGKITIQATAADTDTYLSMTLPIATNLTVTYALNGIGACVQAGELGESVAITGETTSEEAEFRLRPSVTASNAYVFNFTYRL